MNRCPAANATRVISSRKSTTEKHFHQNVAADSRPEAAERHRPLPAAGLQPGSRAGDPARVGRRNCAFPVRTLPLSRPITSCFQLDLLTASAAKAYPTVTDRGHSDRRDENLHRAVGEFTPAALDGRLRPTASSRTRGSCRPAAPVGARRQIRDRKSSRSD
jgi:hypothetical protein